MTTILLIVLAAIANSFMDLSDEGVLSNKLNKDSSWNNKYIIGEFFANKLGIAKSFIQYLFKTALVWTTDFWHFMQFVWGTSLLLSIVFYDVIFGWLGDFILFKSIYTGVFYVVYTSIKRLRQKRADSLP